MTTVRHHWRIPLFGRMLDHSSVPAEHKTAAARSGGSGPPPSRRKSALPRTGASTVAGLRLLGAALLTAATLTSPATAANAVTTPSDVHLRQSHGRQSDAGPYAGFVNEAAQRFAIPVDLIRAVIEVESGGNAAAVSRKGAMGLMQLMPQTWTDLRTRYHLGADPFDPHDNILAGAAYLRMLNDRFGAPGFLAAYNAGPARFEGYRTGLRPLPEETLAYLTKLQRLLPDLHIGGMLTARPAVADWRRAKLFAIAPAPPSSHPGRSPNHSGIDAQAHVTFALAPHSGGIFVAVRMPQK